MSEVLWETGEDFTPEAEDEVIPWVCEPWVVEGCLTELTGEAKEAGKSTWALAMCYSIIHGTEFMGKPTMQCPVVYLTEQPKASFKRQVRDAKLVGNKDFHVLRYANAWEISWPDLMQEAKAKMEETGARVIVIDTFSNWAEMDENQENSAGSVIKVLKPLRVLCADGIAAIIIRHSNLERAHLGAGKSSRGSGSLKGAMDILLDLYRSPGPENRQRRLTALGRFMDWTPTQSTIEWLENKEYVTLGPPKAKITEPNLFGFLGTLPEQALKRKELIIMTGLPGSTLDRQLKEGVESGVLVQLGTRGNYRWYRKSV